MNNKHTDIPFYSNWSYLLNLTCLKKIIFAFDM